MSLKRWWNVLLLAGLAVALSAPAALAWPNRPFGHQPAFRGPAPRGPASGWHNQRPAWNHGRAYGWNHRNMGNRGPAHGWNHRNQWHRPNAYGWNQNGSQWRQPHPAFGRWQQPGNPQFNHYPAAGRPYNAHNPYTPIGSPGQPHSPRYAPRSPGYANNPVVPVNQDSPQSGFQHRGTAGDTSLPQ